MAKYNSQGWHFQTERHSNAKKFGHAGGKYKTFAVKEAHFETRLIKARNEQEAKNKYTAKYGYYGGLRYAKQIKDSDKKTKSEIAEGINKEQNRKNVFENISDKDLDKMTPMMRLSKREIIMKIEEEDQKQGHFYQDGHYRYGVKHYYGKLEKYPKARLIGIYEGLKR